jgi:Na+/proline symporter
MLEVLGPGLLGLLLVSFFAAFMSTIDTHLNWGASYLINDIYKRFLRPDAGNRETVLAAKLCVLLMMVFSVLVSFLLTSIGKAWLFVWAMGAGIGPVLILRWFWWRINAWSEIAALGASVVLAFGFEIVAAVQTGTSYELFSTPVKIGQMDLQTHHKAMILVPVTILTWVIVTFRTRPVTQDRLTSFYRKVRPGGFWGPVAAANPDVQCDGLSWQRMGVWAAGCSSVFGILFGTGKLLLGEPLAATALFGVALLGGVVVVGELRRD